MSNATPSKTINGVGVYATEASGYKWSIGPRAWRWFDWTGHNLFLRDPAGVWYPVVHAATLSDAVSFTVGFDAGVGDK